MSSSKSGRDTTAWVCGWCGGGVSDEGALRDHQEWCLGDPMANAQLLDEIAQREGELTQDALVAAARQRRLAAAEARHLPD
jgi:hypothetical protein